MRATFAAVPFTAIEAPVHTHMAQLPAASDSFLEDNILASAHYQIQVAGNEAGFASIKDGKLITQFALYPGYRQMGQPIFTQLRHLAEVQSAFVPTCDEFYLTHALDEYRQFAKQAYFFAARPLMNRPAVPAQYQLRLATRADTEEIIDESGDFFAPLEQYLADQALFVTAREGISVGYGLLVRAKLLANTASIGMFTRKEVRQGGVGTATIGLLISECERQGLRPVAGCWYYNHHSKQTLERAGMYSGTRLLRVEY